MTRPARTTHARRIPTIAIAAALALGGFATRAAAVPPPSGQPSRSVPCVSIADATVLEGDSGVRTLDFLVTLSQPSTTTVTVQYRIVNGSATGYKKAGPGVDFNNKNSVVGTLKFLVGAKGTTPVNHLLTYTVFGDTTVENDETVRVILSNPTGGAHFARPLAIGTIIDDDSAGAGIHVGVNDVTTVEGNSGTGRTFSFAVTLSNPATSSFTLSYAITGTTAQYGKTATVADADFGGKTAGTLPFNVVAATGKTPVVKKLPVTIWADTRLESDETLTLAISAASLPPGVTITRSAGTGTIIDDDEPPTSDPAPSSMAALGDSITRAFDACPQFGECLAAVWATGTDPLVDSQYSRILAVNPAIAGHAFNDAVSGATMANLPGQAANAVAQGVDYVTIEMGGNDVCSSSEAAMTPVANYENDFQQAMTTLESGLPNARIFVASVPDVERLWFVGKDNASARAAWSNFGICQSMVANPQSTDQADVDRRARVHQRVVDFNTALADVCAQYANCRTDGGVVFNQPFELADISPVDYFHPSFTGQTGLAIATYGAGWNW